MADIVGMSCTECKRRNYSTTVNKKKQAKKLELNKFCKWCGKHTLHKEGKECRILSACRSVAQLAEHWSPKPGVAGSSPAGPAIFILFKKDRRPRLWEMSSPSFEKLERN